jgi:toxin-antitoxin system PIN domain toxin
VIYLFDVNVLLALHDRDHQSHDRVHEFLAGIDVVRWATCAFTEAGFIRIASSPAYPSLDLSPHDAAETLKATVESFGEHQYWSALPSLLDPAIFSLAAMPGHNQVTDVYLLGICQRNKGSLLTLDSRIQLNCIIRPTKHLLMQI